MRKKILSFFLGVLSFFWVISLSGQVQAKCCPTVSVSNFSLLVSLLKTMEQNAWLGQLIPHFVKHFMDQFLYRVATKPGTLQGITLEQLDSELEKDYLNNLNSLVDRYNQMISSGPNRKQKWYCHFLWFLERCKSEERSGMNNVILNTFTWDEVETGDVYPNEVLQYTYSMTGDLAVIAEEWNEFMNQPETKEKVPKFIIDEMALRIANLESAKKNLGMQVLHDAALIRTYAKLRRQLMEMDERVSTASDYTSDQAVKDMLKIQMIQAKILNDMMRYMIESEMRKLAFENARFAGERNDIVKSMIQLEKFARGTAAIMGNGTNGTQSR